MTHAENKVNWCLRKAETELSRGEKHRGMAKKEESVEEAKKHIQKAEHNLSAVSYFNNGGFSDWSMSAVFYCLYHCFLAIALKFGYESRNQECTIALITYLNEQGKIDIEPKFIDALKEYDESERHESNVIEKREMYTYGTTTSAENVEDIGKNIELCKNCLEKTKEIIFGNKKQEK